MNMAIRRIATRPVTPWNLAIPILLGILLLNGGEVAAHPNHTSLSMIDWNPKTQRFEVALRADPLDLERLLARLGKQNVKLDSKAADKLIVEYLKKNYQLFSLMPGEKSSNKKRPASHKLLWVGKEVSPKAAWLYFELSGVAIVEQAKFEVRVFFELDRGHAHTANLRIGTKRQTLRFKQR